MNGTMAGLLDATGALTRLPWMAWLWRSMGSPSEWTGTGGAMLVREVWDPKGPGPSVAGMSCCHSLQVRTHLEDHVQEVLWDWNVFFGRIGVGKRGSREHTR